MSYLLFLDDIRTLKDVPQLPQNADWVIVRSHAEFVKKVTESGLPSFVSFDHDLSDEHVCDYILNVKHTGKIDYDKYQEKTGMSCAKWLVDYCLDNDKKLPLFYVHSANPVGVANITSLLNNFKIFQSNQTEES
jgi:hypothetical protein